MIIESRVTRQKLTLGLLFASPFLIGFFVFTLYPVLASFYFSFCDYNSADAPVFRGVKNYAAMLHDGLFRQAVWNTLYFTLFTVPVTMLVALGLAMLVNLKLRGQAFYRAVFFLPSVVPLVASAVLWRGVYDPRYGILDVFIRWIKGFTDHIYVLPVPGWLTDPGWSKPALILMSVWGAGANMIIYLAALQEVPREQYEAAEIDGATAWQRTRHITLPTISPVLFFTLLVGMISSFQYFTPPYVMTSDHVGNPPGGPANSVLFYAVYLFDNGFQSFKMGYASAMAWVMFIVILVCVALLFRGSRRFVHHE